VLESDSVVDDEGLLTPKVLVTNEELLLEVNHLGTRRPFNRYLVDDLEIEGV
jgi:hypothetical protein